MASSLCVFGVSYATVKKTLNDAPFINVDLAVAAHVEHAQRPPDRLRPDQKLQVRLAAGLEKLDDLLVALLRVHGLDNFVDHERARVVLVHQLKHLSGGGKELGRELGDLLARRGRGLGAPLGPRGELGPQRDLDRLFPFDGRDLAVRIRVDGGHGRVEARGHEQVLQVLVAAVDEE